MSDFPGSEREWGKSPSKSSRGRRGQKQNSDAHEGKSFLLQSRLKT